MPRHRILEQWRDYERKLLDPIKASPIQRKECRRAFYAGAASLMHIVLAGVSPSPDVEPEDLLMMDQLEAEFNEWERDMREGLV